MEIAVSPKMSKYFPELKNAKDHPYTFFRMTLCHQDERDEFWIRSRHRRLRPYFCSSKANAEEVLRLLRYK